MDRGGSRRRRGVGPRVAAALAGPKSRPVPRHRAPAPMSAWVRYRALEARAEPVKRAWEARTRWDPESPGPPGRRRRAEWAWVAVPDYLDERGYPDPFLERVPTFEDGGRRWALTLPPAVAYGEHSFWVEWIPFIVYWGDDLRLLWRAFPEGELRFEVQAFELESVPPGSLRDGSSRDRFLLGRWAPGAEWRDPYASFAPTPDEMFQLVRMEHAARGF